MVNNCLIDTGFRKGRLFSVTNTA